MDKKEEKIDQEGFKPLEQQVKNSHNSNVWLVFFFVLLSSLTIFAFRYSEKVFYNRVNFIFKKRNAVKPKEESKWELFNHRFLIPLVKVVGFILLLLLILELTLKLGKKLRECFFGSEKKRIKEVDDIRNIFFYGRDHHEAEEEMAKILKFLLKFLLKNSIDENDNDIYNKEKEEERIERYKKLQLVLISPDFSFNFNEPKISFIKVVNFLVDEKPGTEKYEEGLRQVIKEKFYHCYYKYMNKSSFLLKNKDFYNYKNNACISFIFTFFNYLCYLCCGDSKDAIMKKYLADDIKNQKKFDEIYGNVFDFVVRNIKKFLDDVVPNEKKRFIKKEEQLEGSESGSLSNSFSSDKESLEEENEIRFQYFLDGCQKNCLSITLENFIDYLFEERARGKKNEDPSYNEKKELDDFRLLGIESKNHSDSKQKLPNFLTKIEEVDEQNSEFEINTDSNPKPVSVRNINKGI